MEKQIEEQIEEQIANKKFPGFRWNSKKKFKKIQKNLRCPGVDKKKYCGK